MRILSRALVTGTWFALASLLAWGPHAVAAATTGATYHYLDPARVDLMNLLPPPPDPNSAAASEDERNVAQIVAQRTPAQLADALDESQRTVFIFEPSVGAGFSPERLPTLAAFFDRVESDVEQLVRSAKDYYQRPRPAGAPEKHGSYPSSHAAFAAATAIILSQMLPEKRDAIFTQARLFAENRIILGLHYPTDIAAGWITGTLAAAAMMNDEAYKTDFAAAKRELRRRLASP